MTANPVLKILVLLVAVLMMACASQGTANQGGAMSEFGAQASEVYPARYTDFTSSYTVDPRYGDILEAARGTTSDGRRVMALLVRGSNNYDPEGAQDYWESQVPSPFRILIVIDESTNRVAASRIVRDGTIQPIFTVPREKLDAYKEVVINSETAFDGFKGGLVTGKQFEIELDEYEISVIAGTTLYYTGATVQGTYSSQLIRNCFMAAARFFINNK